MSTIVRKEILIIVQITEIKNRETDNIENSKQSNGNNGLVKITKQK